jgi:hypothetical protein
MTKAGLLEAVTTSVCVDHVDGARELDAPCLDPMSPSRARRSIDASLRSAIAPAARAGRSPLTIGPAREFIASRGDGFRSSSGASGL